MRSFKIENKPNHKLVKAIRLIYGSKYDKSYLTYFTRTDSDYGWNLDGFFISFTIDESVKIIKSKKW